MIVTELHLSIDSNRAVRQDGRIMRVDECYTLSWTERRPNYVADYYEFSTANKSALQAEIIELLEHLKEL